MPESRLPYIRVAVTLPRHPKLEALPRSARWLLVELWCYCHEARNDGVVPVAAWSARGTRQERQALLTAGWATEDNDVVRMSSYLEYQQSREEIEALSSKRSAAGKAGAAAKATKRSASAQALAEQASSNPQAELAVASHEATERTSGKPAAPLRIDVEQVCSAVVAAEVAKGSKKPTVTEGWRTQARLMLDNDHRELPDVLAVIEWTRDHSFWRSNIRSVPKLREQFDTLRLQREADGGRPNRDAQGRVCPPGQEHLESWERTVSVRTDW